MMRFIKTDVNGSASMTRRGSGRRRTVGVALVGAALAGGVAFAGPAAAVGSSYISSNSGGANLRTCQSTTCGAIKYLSNGNHVQMVCYKSGQSVSPPESNYTSDRWFKVNTDYGTGYVHSSLVAAQTSVGYCP